MGQVRGFQPSKSLSGVGTTFSDALDLGGAVGGGVGMVVEVTAVGGTTPSLTLSVEWSNDGTNWATADPADAFTAITTAPTRLAKSFLPAKGRWLRLKEALTGTTPTATYSASAHVAP